MEWHEYYDWQPLPAPAVKNRIKCPNCGKTRKVEIRRDAPTIAEMIGRIGKPGKGWRWAYPLAGAFCTLRCGCEYANKILNGKAK